MDGPQTDWRRYKHYAIYAGLGLLLILWIQAEVRAAMLRKEMEQLRPVSVTLQAIDDATKDPLRAVVQAPAVSGNWPKAFSIESVDSNRVRLSWIGIDPVQIGVSAEGYPQQAVKLDENSPSSVVVALKKQ